MQKIIGLLRVALGVIFFWYGMLKFFPELSPAEELATMTINWMFFGLIPNEISLKLLALWEVLIGVCFIFGFFTRYITILFLVHMFLTFLPLVAFPDLSFTKAPYAFTLVGQYIVKNIVFILVGFLIYFNEIDKKRVSLI